MLVCVCLWEQEETARVQKRTQGASRVPVMFYILIWVLAVPLYSPAKVYQATVMIYDIGSTRILHFKKKSVLKRERKTCKDSYPWPLKYHSSPSKSRLLRHTSTSPCLSTLDPTWPLCWAPNTSALQYLHPQYSLHETSSQLAPTDHSKSISLSCFPLSFISRLSVFSLTRPFLILLSTSIHTTNDLAL